MPFLIQLTDPQSHRLLLDIASVFRTVCLGVSFQVGGALGDHHLHVWNLGRWHLEADSEIQRKSTWHAACISF